MLTDYETYQQNQPYFSDPNNDPAYARAAHTIKFGEKFLHTAQDVGIGIAGALVPGLGPLATTLRNDTEHMKGSVNYLGDSIMAHNDMIEKYRRDHANRPEPANATAKNPMGESKLGAFGSFLNKDSVSGIQKLIANNKATAATKAFSNNAFAQDAVQNPVDTSQFNTDPNAYGSDSASSVSGVGTGQTIDTNPSSGNMDWSSLGTGDGSLGTDTGGLASFKKGGSIVVGDDGVKLKYMDGGKLKYFGGGESKAGGEGGTKDNIALVNTDTGKDTGVRVSKGEMLVVSKENLESLHKAIKKKDHKGVFSIMKHQVEQAPMVQDGTHGFVKGGPTSTADEITYDGKPVEFGKKPKTYKELMARYNELKDILDNPNSIKTGYTDASTFQSAKTNAIQKLKSEYKGLESVVNKRSTGTGLDVNINSDVSENDLKEISGSSKLQPAPSTEVDITAKKTDPTTTGTTDPASPEFKAPAQTAPQDIPSMTTPADYRGGAADATVPQKVPADNTTFPAADPNKPFDFRHGMDVAGDVLGTGFDIGRGIAGWNAANKPLPQWNVPPSWGEYGNRLKGMSTEGLTAAEMANYQRQIGEGYAYDTANVRDISGGNSGQALGNLGRAAGQFYGAQGQVAGLDAGLHRQNMAAYGSWLGNDVNISRMKFNDRYQEDYQNKISGAQLANDAITNLKNRADFQRQYGTGSDYSQLMGLQKDNLAETNDILKQNKNYYLTHPDAFKPASVGSSASDGSGDGTFADYLAWKKTQNK